MPVEPRFELARAADAAHLAGMSRRLIEQGLSWRWDSRAIVSAIRDPETSVVVARCDERIVGFAAMSFRFSRHAAHLVLLAVDPGWRRRGVGRSLWRWLETVARRGGVGRVALEVRAANPGARAFYGVLGFREGARLTGYYDSREDAVRMVAEIGGRSLRP